MGVDHPGSLYQEVQRQKRAERRNGKATMQNASISRANFTVRDGGRIVIEDGGLSVTGTASVAGTLDVTGTETVSGTLTVTGHLNGNGDIDWTGPVVLRGEVDVTGNSDFSGTMHIGGATTIDGNVTLNSDLSVGSGRIVVGPLILDKAGGYGARVYSGGTLFLDGGTNVVVGAPLQATGGIGSIGDITAVGNLSVTGDVGGVTKSFWIDHPTKPGKQLRHGSLEGPEHGVYYRGVVTFDANGEAVFELPDYFTDLVMPDDVPTVHVTGVGRPFMTGFEPVADGRVTIYGEQNREAHVTVTAARGLFDVETVKEVPVTALP